MTPRTDAVTDVGNGRHLWGSIHGRSSAILSGDTCNCVQNGLTEAIVHFCCIIRERRILTNARPVTASSCHILCLICWTERKIQCIEKICVI